MQKSWSLLEELIIASQRWYVILAFILIGALVGAGIAFIIPGPYQATSDMYVGLDVYRTMEDLNIPIRPEGANDYKNWQMENLKMIMTSVPVLNRTLDLLRIEDNYWLNINKRALLNMLELYWRNAGRWRLVAVHPDNRLADQAVTAWKTAALEYVHNTVEQSRQVLLLDAQIKAIAARQAETLSQRSQLEQSKNRLHEFKDQQIPLDQPLGDSQRIELTSIAASGGLGQNPSLVDIFPGTGSNYEQYLPWLDSLEQQLDINHIGLEKEMADLTSELENLESQYANASANSYGISANLIVEDQDGFTVESKKIRPLGNMILIGALTGLLTWLIYQVFAASRRTNHG